MTINLTRLDILVLMGDLPAEHWFQRHLMDELHSFNSQATTPEPKVASPTVLPADTTNTTCNWTCYGDACKVNTVEGSLYCVYHTGRKCYVCEAPADHGCPMELQFVCGGPLCPKHHYCDTH